MSDLSFQITFMKDRDLFNKSTEVTFRFEYGNRSWSSRTSVEHLKDEKERMGVLRHVARSAMDELLVSEIVDQMLNAMVSSALRGENPLE